jgi:type IV pilus assembly protein PilM
MVGIDISDRSIKIAELTDRALPQLLTVCWSPVPSGVIRRGVARDVPTLVGILQNALQKCSPVPVVGRKVVVSIPEIQSFVRVVELPQMVPTELDEAVQWAVRQHIPFDLDHVYLDWQQLSTPAKNPNYQQVLVGAAPREVVDPLLSALDGVKLTVVAFELESQALVRSLLPRDSVDVRGILIIDLGATATNIIYFDQGAMRFTTSIEQGGDDLTQRLVAGLHLQPDVAAEQKMLVGVTDMPDATATVSGVLRESTKKLLERIEQVVRQVTAQTEISQHDIQAILLAGGAANLPGLVELFADVFPGVPVQTGNPWTNIMTDDRTGAAPLSKADALHFTTALGLALRHQEP